MIKRIDTEEQLEEFNNYWESENDADLKEKVEPKPYKKQGTVKARYVVKSFRTEEGKPATPVLSNSPTCAFSYTCGTNHTESVSDASLALLQVTVEVCGSETEVQRNWVKGGALARRAPAKQRLGSSPICRQYLPMATS